MAREMALLGNMTARRQTNPVVVSQAAHKESSGKHRLCHAFLHTQAQHSAWDTAGAQSISPLPITRTKHLSPSSLNRDTCLLSFLG